MKFNSIFLISRIRESANNFIINELKKAGIKGIAPSHGDIMAALYKEDKIPMNLLAKKIRRTKATLTVLADKLVELLVPKTSSGEFREVLTSNLESFLSKSARYIPTLYVTSCSRSPNPSAPALMP